MINSFACFILNYELYHPLLLAFLSFDVFLSDIVFLWQLLFGEEGYLYIFLGDGGQGSDRRQFAQNR